MQRSAGTRDVALSRHESVSTRQPTQVRPAATVWRCRFRPTDRTDCIIEVGSDTPHQLALYIGLLDIDFEILDPPELAAAFIRLADRYQRAARES